MRQKLPFKLQIAYALGQFGWSLLAGIISSFLIFYYIPSKDSGILSSIPQITFFGIFSIIGLITMLGRFFDAITDPLIATLSDRSTSKYGRRISFMRFSAIPFAILTILVFVNPVKGESILNAFFLAFTLLSFYLFFTMYVTPYLALISELGHTPEERLNLSTYISATWFLGFAISSQAPVLWNIFVDMGYDKPLAMRITFAILSLIALIFLLIPVFTIDEKKYSVSSPSELKMMDSIKATFKNKDFRIFVFSDLVYWVAITVFQSALLFYITVLLNMKEEFFGLLFVLLGVGSFLFYIPINIIAKKIGKKKIMIIAFLMFIIAYVYGFFLGNLPIPNNIQAFILVALAAIPMAVFGIIPNVIVADIAEYDSKKTGISREAMFFGTRTFMSKIGQMISMIILSSLLLIEKNGSNAIGIRLTTLVAALFCLVGLILFMMYDEKKILNFLLENESDKKAI